MGVVGPAVRVQWQVQQLTVEVMLLLILQEGGGGVDQAGIDSRQVNLHS